MLDCNQTNVTHFPFFWKNLRIISEGKWHITKTESCQYICVVFFLPQHQDAHEPNSGLTTSYRHFSAPYLGAITPSSLCVHSCPPQTNWSQVSISFMEGLKAADHLWELSWAVCHRSKKHHGRVQLMCSFSNTFSILEEDIHLLVFSCPRGGLRSGSATDWHPCRADTLESRCAEIWDDLPNQQEALPPPCLLCLPIIRPDSLPARQL